jgi:hypothetical protein
VGDRVRCRGRVGVKRPSIQDPQRSYLDGFLGGAGALFVVLGLLVLLGSLGQVGVVGQLVEEGGDHGMAVNLLLEERWEWGEEFREEDQ